MWYTRTSSIKPEVRSIGLEENIAQACAERAIMRQMILNCEYDPSPSEVIKITKRVMSRLEKKFGNFNLIRNEMHGETIREAVDQIVREVMT